MGPRRLYSRIYFHFLAVLLVVGFLSSAVFATGWRVSFLRNWTHKLAHHAALLVAAQPDAAARARMVRHLTEELDLDVTLRRPDGTVEVTSGPELPRLTPEELAEASARTTILHHGKDWFVAAPLHDLSGGFIGILETFPMRHFAPAMLWRPIGLVALALVVIGLATAPLARRISRPIERLTEGARRLGQGELSYRVPVHEHHRRAPGFVRRHHHRRRDELGELTQAFNDMAERVEGLVRGQRELLANVSHELRSPLARVQVALELLPADPSTQARVRDLRGDLAELERLIDDVLTTSRLDAVGFVVRKAPVEVAPLYAQLVERAGHDPATAGIEVRSEGAIDGELPADHALLKRALWNLVENAAKYGAPPIALSVARAEGRVQLSVTDAGPGIPPADRERVFDPFFRADKARTPGRAAGFGLGLTLARRVAEAHGGTARIDAARPDGTGCRVTLDLPV